MFLNGDLEILTTNEWMKQLAEDQTGHESEVQPLLVTAEAILVTKCAKYVCNINIGYLRRPTAMNVFGTPLTGGALFALDITSVTVAEREAPAYFFAMMKGQRCWEVWVQLVQ